MNQHSSRVSSNSFNGRLWLLRLLAIMASMALATAQAVTISAKGPAGESVLGFSYTIELDDTFDVVPDVTGLSGNLAVDPTLALAFHRSHMKVVKVGSTTTGSVSWTPPSSTARYFVSVQPTNTSFNDPTPTGYTMSGSPIRPGDIAVIVPVNKLPFRTSQVSVFIFEDSTINGAPDAPGAQELGLCGFEVRIFEAGGTYGASGGLMSTDTFGNPLGTEYALTAAGDPQYNPDGSLMVSKLGANQLWTDANGVLRIKNLSPAKYTIYAIAPPVKPSVARCHFADAVTTPIWVDTPAQITRVGQIAWTTPFEFKSPNLEDTAKWHQTTTIEGTWGVDAWVKAGEPTFFKEFGPPGHHVFHGFTRRYKDTTPVTGMLASGGATVSGTVKSVHLSRPPGIRFETGAPMTSCWVGINAVTSGVGLGSGLYANSCNPDGSFSISGLRPGRYQLAVWDEPLDNVIANYEFSVTGTTAVALGDVPVFSWFSNLRGKVFYDADATGFPYTGTTEKKGIPNQIVNIRFRDGSIYNSTVTDDNGDYEFAEVFPFFNWMVAETDFTRFKATGATVIADNGGVVANPPAATPNLWPTGTMTPQLIGGSPYRIFGGLDGTGQPVAPSSANLLQAFQGFLGQTNVIHWGKKDYAPSDPNDHGGITGVIHYASTRAEFDPKFATAENNEPGIPNVEIRLYKLNAQNKVIDPRNGAIIEPKNATADHAIQIATSDGFDNASARPTECVDPLPYGDRTNPTLMRTPSGNSVCYDGLRNWNQVRDGVFDGGWAFVDYCPSGAVAVRNTAGELERDANGDFQIACRDGSVPINMPPGRYMTEGIAPYGYEHQKEEDKNVDFGDLLIPGTLANPAECMGSRTEALAVTYDASGNPVPISAQVPAELNLFPGVEIPARFLGTALAPRPYCNKKLVVVAPGANPFSDFHMFTRVPVAGHIVGMILDDLANEFDPYSPSFGEKFAPPFMPVSIRDYAGNEVNRVYSDRYGTYNAMVPSTFAYNVPLPSGVAPNMVNVCLNSPTMKVRDATGVLVTKADPHYNPQYSQYCYTFQYLPGKTTYLDTPVLPIAAFAGPSQGALDCEAAPATPGIKMVTGTASVGDVGPWVPSAGTAADRTIRITSMGLTKVSNPDYNQNDLGNPATVGVAPKLIDRNYGFGASAGQLRVGGTLIAAANVTWTDALITAVIPASTVLNPAGLSGGTIEVTHANGNKSTRGVTLHQGTTNMASGRTRPITVGQGTGFDFTSIQAAIDATSTVDGDLITVAPGFYEEAPILWKRVRVQGYGAPVTVVNASMGAEYLRQQAWREKVCTLVLTGLLGQGAMASALLPGQTVPATMDACLTGDTADNAPLLFAEEEASGFFVLQKPQPAGQNLARGPFVGAIGSIAGSGPVRALQIDGFTITGADTGGGIVANGYATQLQISNNRITGNQGLYNGGIRIGHAELANPVTLLPVSGNNALVNIHNNEILKNGNLAGEVAGGGGGISMYTGSDGYRVAQNAICGNFSTGEGGGLAHYGVSNAVSAVTIPITMPVIDQDNRTNLPVLLPLLATYHNTVSNNVFLFNQSFSQAKSVQGGGMSVTGVQDPTVTNGRSLGTGNLVIANNTFQGNLAGAGDGGGISLVGVNGTETIGSTSKNTCVLGTLLPCWYRVDVINNVIVNNGAGVAGGGIALQDAANVHIVNNTIALNDSYATAARAFSGLPGSLHPTNAQNLRLLTESVVQNGAGIAAYGHSPGLLGVATNAGLADARYFSNATITDSVVLANRSFSWKVDYAIDQTTCSYNTANGSPCFGLTPQASPLRSGNDIAVLISPVANAKLAPTYSVFTTLHSAVGEDGTSFAAGNNNRAGVAADFASAYANGSNTNGALKQLIFSLEQTVATGAPVLEVQEPTVVTSAAAFDEGGNFIDVRFTPLTDGAPVGVGGSWVRFGTYRPTVGAIDATTGDFRLGTSTFTGYPPLTSSLLLRDRNGTPRVGANWIRGAFTN